jgi:AraC-like DNA-binding protein
MRLLTEGGSATAAAHAVGFADAAHPTRTASRMNGVTPSDMEPVSRWLVAYR